MHVVATAGHVDHGKSTLVRALTGQDPDRLEEERRRGLSIQLGYCWTTLEPVGEVAFVDVPGHERFVTTTLAGLGPVPVALLVVAADDPWMPQAAEHLAALDGLGVEHGVVAVSRSDLADPAAAVARARAEVDATSLRGARVLPVSGRTGAGLPALRSELARLLAALPEPDPAAPVRLWVDRAFHVRGTGTVVTGTLPAGTVRPGDALQVAGSGDDVVRVRSVQSLERDLAAVSGVARVALALSGRLAARVHRGDVLVTPDSFELTRVVDVRLATGPGPARSLPERPLLHVGATSLAVHARPLGGDADDHGPRPDDGRPRGTRPGGGCVRLTLERALPLRLGDRAVLRDPGDRRTWGVRVLDPAPPDLARRGAAASRAQALAGADGSVADEVDRRGLVDRALLRRLGATGSAPPGAVEAGAWLVSGGHATRLAARLSAYAGERSDPDRPGVALAEVTRALDLPDDAVTAALVPLAPPRSPGWRVERGRVVPDVEDDAPTVPPRLAAALAAVREDLAEAPFAAPDAGRLRGLGLGPAEVALLARQGHLLRVGEGVVLLPGADDRAVALLAELEQPFTTSRARGHLGTSRRVALPLLDHLDRTGRTVRLADDRRRLRG